MATATTTAKAADTQKAEPTSTALPADTLTKCMAVLSFSCSFRSFEVCKLNDERVFSIATDKTAAEIGSKALQLVIAKAVKGSNLLSLCQEGDKSIDDACALVYNKDKKNPTKKGIAFPCTISINKCVLKLVTFCLQHSDDTS